MNIFLKQSAENESFRTLKNLIDEKKNTIYASGVIESQKCQLIYSLENFTKRCSLVITESESKANEVYEDLRFFLKDKVKLYRNKDILFYSADIKSMDIIKDRFQIIDALIKKEAITIVLTAEALFDKLVMPDIFKKFIIKLKVGGKINTEKLLKKLVYMGYERSEIVEGRGQFSIRGGIIDIYSSVGNNAYRIELWGDEIDSIRTFDPISQRSTDKVEECEIFPMRELVYSDEELKNAEKKIKSEYTAALKVFRKKELENEAENLEESIGEMLDKLSQERSFSGIDRFIGYFYEETASLLDYLSDDTIIYFDEPARIREHCDYIMSEFTQSMKNRIEHGYIMSGQADTIYNYDEIIRKAENFTKILLSGIMYSVKGFKINEIVEFKIKSTPLYKGNIEMLADEFTYLTKNKYKILFLTGTKTGCEKLRDELVSRDIRAEYIQDLEADMLRGIVYIARGSLKSGFEYIDEKFVIMSDDSQISEKKKKKRPTKKKGAALISNFTELKIGDYIVHDIHGIGIFRGIEEMVSEGIKKDYLKIAYQNDGYLYISTDRMDMIQKYIGNEGIKPKIDKLGATQWAKNKARAKKAAMIQAEELIKIYAKRRESKGFAYSPDTVWQSEFEDSFIYEETDDQLNAIADVKEDMQSDKAMDRLICGDVGYGKTEVAIRAAFKAVQDGKQVAMLVPTTILAQQHYSTFISRMKDYPINIEMLSRFRTVKQQKETLAKLKKGIVDIVIGTHRLLSKDVEFADLGLLIIDEEQRFGVAHKEKLKIMKENVDALALSATPIPRTLHMSLAGIRDMSILEEPPNERMPIQTYVMQYNEDSVREAIHREMARGGQVYYLHNRVANIEEVALKVQEIVPEANIGYAHGQMSERELENIMISFMNGDIDVLVCTTIIETGLDIPNVNTIIIQDSDRMGLSQLYQLRGRVGRSNRIAFAYLMYKRDKVLREESQKRLQTIREFTEFGSGFKVAMRDLEIRGAGNMLGAQQHGHLDNVGYDLYCRLLDNAIKELNGEKVQKEFETVINVAVNALIPSSYIKDENQRLEMYKNISMIHSREDYNNVQEEFEDRFGDLPHIVQNLLDVAMMKYYAHRIGVTSIIQKGNTIDIAFMENPDGIDRDRLISEVNSNKKLSFSSTLKYKVDTGEKDFVKKLEAIFERLWKDENKTA